MRVQYLGNRSSRLTRVAGFLCRFHQNRMKLFMLCFQGSGNIQLHITSPFHQTVSETKTKEPPLSARIILHQQMPIIGHGPLPLRP
jgi:hypothetical protein